MGLGKEKKKKIKQNPNTCLIVQRDMKPSILFLQWKNDVYKNIALIYNDWYSNLTTLNEYSLLEDSFFHLCCFNISRSDIATLTIYLAF